MAKLAKLLQAAAGAAGGGGGLNVEDVFSTFVYEGNATARDIENGIDLSTEGGLVWSKSRSSGVGIGDNYHYLFDTERGSNKYIFSNVNNAEVTSSLLLTSFNTDGYSIGTRNANNQTGEDYASWTFRKAPKFFDVVTYTGNGTAGRTVSHNLDSVPAVIIVKRTDTTSQWVVYHRSTSANPQNDYLILQTTASAYLNQDLIWNNTAPTSSEFTVGSNSTVNASGGTYVAYLFAHNDGDGEFGPDGDADIIKCDSYTCAPTGIVDLGFEPQWIMIKRASGTGDWVMFDAMRGLVVEGNDAYVYANTSGAEVSNTRLNITPTGFSTDTTDYRISSNGETYIYIAIRRGPMAVPESASEVFDVSIGSSNGNIITTGFPVDTQILNFTLGDTNNSTVIDRLRGFSSTSTESGKRLVTSSTAAETSAAVSEKWTNTGFTEVGSYGSVYACYWNWRRASSFFDVVAYTGNGTAGRTVSHNLGAVPEMMWVKSRSNARRWTVYHKDIGNTKRLVLNTTAAEETQSDWNSTTPTDSVFTLGGGSDVNTSSYTYIAYLFASLDGVSKVGSFSHTNNTTTSVDCGFSSGARFVMIKLSDGADSWYIWDTERGINSGTEPYLRLNTNSAQVTGADWIDPLSSGFQITGPDLLTGTYIFYAIA